METRRALFGRARVSLFGEPGVELGDAAFEPGDDPAHHFRVAVGERDVRDPEGLGQPFLAVVTVGDRNAEKGFLGRDPLVALRAQRVQADAAGFPELASAEWRAASRKGWISCQSIFSLPICS